MLDNVTPIRQLASSAPSADLQLLAPAPAVRARWDNNEDTPLPIETPAAPNPPEGAVIDYYLAHAITGELTLTVTDERGEVVRRYSSSAKTSPSLPANVPSVLVRAAGGSLADRWAEPFRMGFPLSGAEDPAVRLFWRDAAVRRVHAGRSRDPGAHAARPAAGSARGSGPVHARAVSRRPARDADARGCGGSARHGDAGRSAAQLTLARRLMGGLSASYDGYTRLADLRVAIADDTKALGAAKDSTTATTALAVFEKQIEHVQNGTTEAPGLGTVNREMARLFSMVESADVPAHRTARSGRCRVVRLARQSLRGLGSVERRRAVGRERRARRSASTALIEVPSPPSVTSCPR